MAANKSRMPEATYFKTFVYLLCSLAVIISACNCSQSENNPISTPTPTDEMVPTSKREAYYINMPSQPGVVVYNRVEAFIQAHDFMDAFQAALSDGQFSEDELEQIAQLAANAEASLYNTGDWPLFEHARQIDKLSKHAFRGELAQAEIGIGELKRSLPRRPRP